MMLEQTNEYKLENIAPPVDNVTFYAAHLAAVEAAVGTVIHSAHIPLGGHLLSLNEGACLARATNECSTRKQAALACYEIAGVSATFKSLAPAAKKLGPMLSIMMQGLLFAFGVLVAGRGRLGQMLGFIFLSTWAFVQPFITLLISFGPSELTRVINFYGDRLQSEYAGLTAYSVAAVILALFVIKCIAGAAIVFIMPKIKINAWMRWQQIWITRAEKLAHTKSRQNLSAWRGALRDLTQPVFLISFALTFIFLFVQKEKLTAIVWLGLRPLAIAFLIFYLLRAPWFVDFCGRWAQKLGLLRPIYNRLARVREHHQNAKNRH
jgi:hypothetical protein